MCRMIMASGDFDVAKIMAAAVAMSRGESADHDNATVRHCHGWGAIWRNVRTGDLGIHRDTRPAWQGIPSSGLTKQPMDFLAIHVRNATLKAQEGAGFTHPLSRPGDDWHFMHNGYMPTVHQLLGLQRSEFDSAEYFDYLIPPGTAALREEDVLHRLRAIPPGSSTSGNAIAVRRDGASIVHWSPRTTPTPRFFTLHEYATPEVRIIASERVPALANLSMWQGLPPESVLNIPFPSREAT